MNNQGLSPLVLTALIFCVLVIMVMYTRCGGLVTKGSIVLVQEEDDESDGEKEVEYGTYLEGRIFSIQ